MDLTRDSGSPLDLETWLQLLPGPKPGYYLKIGASIMEEGAEGFNSHFFSLHPLPKSRYNMQGYSALEISKVNVFKYE